MGEGCPVSWTYKVAVYMPALELLGRVRFTLALGRAKVHDQGVAPVFGLRGDAVLGGRLVQDL